MEIVHDDDDVERGNGKRYSVGFQIHDLCAQRNSAVRSGLTNSHHCRQVSIESQGVEAAGRKPSRVSAAAARDIERAARDRKKVRVVDEPASRLHCHGRDSVARVIAFAATHADDHAH